MVDEKLGVPVQSGCCVGCAFWGKFQHKCWYFWEHKKGCTQFLGEAELDLSVDK